MENLETPKVEICQQENHISVKQLFKVLCLCAKAWPYPWLSVINDLVDQQASASALL